MPRYTLHLENFVTNMLQTSSHLTARKNYWLEAKSSWSGILTSLEVLTCH